MTAPTPYSATYEFPTFAAAVFRCRTCGRLSRISVNAIEDMREEDRVSRLMLGAAAGEPDDMSDEALANTLEYCLSCLDGVEYPAEHDFTAPNDGSHVPAVDADSDFDSVAYDAACDERSYGDPYREEDDAPAASLFVPVPRTTSLIIRRSAAGDVRLVMDGVSAGYFADASAALFFVSEGARHPADWTEERFPGETRDALIVTARIEAAAARAGAR